MTSPTVSIVCATYNRADQLALTIRSVRQQTFTDWELIVVGDLCTDHTADVVASFNDRRITFVNRSENFGEQSAPNNDGVALARGQYVAFVNHDDIWFPEHLTRCVDAIQTSGADMVFTGYARIWPDHSVTIASGGSIRRRRLFETPPVTTWIVRPELYERLEGWRSAFDLRLTPSCDFVLRALAAGADIRELGDVTAALVSSSNRPGSYTDHAHDDDELAAAFLGDDPHAVLDSLPTRVKPPLARVVRPIWDRLTPLFALAGIDPFPLRERLRALRNQRKPGDIIRAYRKTRGLPSEPDRMST
jgi:glycosyltransferase involved in cell wall biosynthesis